MSYTHYLTPLLFWHGKGDIVVMTHFFRSSIFALTLAGCASPMDSDPTESVDPASITQDAVSRSPYRNLNSGTRTTLVDGITAAENLLFTSDGRLFATGDDGVFAVRRDATGNVTAMLVKSASACKFTGMTEFDGVIYASCYDSSSSSVYAAQLSSAPDFRLLSTLSGVTLANGLTHDDSGHLYVAQTMQNQILRLTLDSNDPFQVASTDVWLSGSGLFTNGLKLVDSSIYWTDFGGIKRARISSNGDAGRVRTIASDLTFFDDLFIDDDALLVADYLGNAVRAYTLRGRRIAQTAAVFTSPSSVLPAHGRLGLGANDLVVTEKGANRIAVYSSDP